MDMASTTVGPVKKFLVLSATSSELENATPGTASAVIASVLGTSCSKSLNKAAFDASPGRRYAARWIASRRDPYGAAPAGPAALAANLAALVAAIGAAGINPATRSLTGPREAMLIKSTIGPKFHSTVLMTLGLAPKAIACFAPSAVFTGTSGLPEIETNRRRLSFENTAPTDISTAGTPPAVAYPVR